MESKHYWITKWPYAPRGEYRLRVIHGPMDVEELGTFPKMADARAAAKAHAARTGVKPIILT